MTTTVLVFCYKYKTLDKRKKLTKFWLLSFSKVLIKLATGLSAFLGKNMRLNKANAMLVEFLGTDLSKINNELEKLQINLPVGSTITPKHIEENGFSKDFNVFVQH
jgi:DNA polymerase-3 subunit delta